VSSKNYIFQTFFFTRVTKAFLVLPVPLVILDHQEYPVQGEKMETLDHQDFL